jgi:hypothetical protein
MCCADDESANYPGIPKIHSKHPARGAEQAFIPALRQASNKMMMENFKLNR